MAMLNPYNYKRPSGTGMPVKNEVRQKAVSPANGYNNKQDAYLETKVLSAKPEELTFMLYEGMVKFIKQAKIFNEQRGIEKSNTANLRAQAILKELRATLNMDYEISDKLDQVYVFMLDRLYESNMHKDNTILDEVLDLAEDLRDTWKEAMGL